MKKMLLVLLACLLAACAPATPAVLAATAMVAVDAPTGTAVPSSTRTAPTVTPLPTATPTPMPTATPVPFTVPAVAARAPMYMDDHLGFPSTLLALPGGQVWETTSGGGVRVYDSATIKVIRSLDLGAKDKQFSRLVGDEKYVWALFYSPMEGANPARLFRISRADFSYQPVPLPGTCTYDNCLWSYPLIDGEIFWLGGYDVLWGFDRESLEPRVKFLLSEQAQVFLPAQVADLDVTGSGQVWALSCTDICYIVMLDRQKLLDGVEQEPPKIFFENNAVQFVTELNGTMWAAEASSGNADAQQAVLYPLEGDIEADLSPQDGILLPSGLDFLEISGNSNTRDGTYLWIKDTGGRKLFWFDPVKREVAGILPVYPGDTPTAEDPRVIFSLSFDGQYLWTGGTEILRIALPWVGR